MRTYVVQPGESAADIAAKFAGCPLCVRDLVASNPSKTFYTESSGYVTLASVSPGETINLPDKWFNGMLDTLPKSYFESLPRPSGMLADFSGFGLRAPLNVSILGFIPKPSSLYPAVVAVGGEPPLWGPARGGGIGPAVVIPDSNGGVKFSPTRATAPTTPMSTGTKVAIGVGVVAAAGLAWWALS